MGWEEMEGEVRITVEGYGCWSRLESRGGEGRGGGGE